MSLLKAAKDLPFANAQKIRTFQEKCLQAHLHYCASKSPYYRQLFSEQNISAAAFTLEGLASLPLTDKGDLGAHNDDFCAVPPEKIVDIVLSSGTTGEPTRIMYTEEDLQRLAYNEESSLRGCGLTDADRVLLTCTLDRCFIAGLAYFSGVRALGAAAIRNGQNSLESHAEIIKRLQPTVIVGVPSFLKKLGLFLQQSDSEKAKSSVKKLICIGEPVKDKDLLPSPVARDLEKNWQAQLYSTYASSETITAFCECSAGRGGHLLPDLAAVEILDEKNRVLPAGEIGEVVVTPFGMTGMPLIRFKTGDISFIIEEPCTCGRQTPRLGPILGRKAQMLKLFGTTVYPNAIFAALDEIAGIKEYYLEATSENSLADRVCIHLAVDSQVLDVNQIREKLQAQIRVKPEVKIESIESIQQIVFSPHSRKPIRFFDKRTRN